MILQRSCLNNNLLGHLGHPRDAVAVRVDWAFNDLAGAALGLPALGRYPKIAVAAVFIFKGCPVDILQVLAGLNIGLAKACQIIACEIALSYLFIFAASAAALNESANAGGR
jgi:hypothetical protein